MKIYVIRFNEGCKFHRDLLPHFSSPLGYIKSFSDEEFCLEILSFMRDFLSTLIKPLFSLEDENYRCIRKINLKK